LSKQFGLPDAPARHHLPFDRLTALSKVEGRRCLLSLLPRLRGGKLATCCSSAPYI
jgi:hypothetical protein